jgi:ribose transport system substrate-binding protein
VTVAEGSRSACDRGAARLEEREMKAQMSRVRRLAAPGACLATVAVLAACGSSSTSGSGGSGGSSSASGSSTATNTAASSTSATSGGSGSLAQVVSREEGPAHYAPPTTPLKQGLSRYRGRTVYYIPFAQVITSFAIEGAALKQALAAAGLKLETCDGGANPEKMSACVNQATNANAAGIVTSGLSYGLAAQAFDRAKAKKIPILLADQDPVASSEVRDEVAYLDGSDSAIQKAIAQWVVVDSGGKANILVAENTDNPTSVADIVDMQMPVFKQCSGCSEVVDKVSTANTSLIPSSVSAALLKNPNVNYVDDEFDQFLEAAESGTQQANASSRVKGVSTTAVLSGLQHLKASNFLYADAGADFPYQGWAAADELFRMLVKMPTPVEAIPLRLFTRDNVGSLSLTQAAQNDGAWFGSLSYRSTFEKLWGVK